MPIEKKPGRAIICAKDIQGMTGRKRTYSYKLIREIRLKYNKKPYDMITVREFSEYTGISEEIVLKWLNGE